ncbi:MAG: GNAT family N-acetyltransferase [Anaerolineales bacterium]|nr:MAG: GNAT family N-acetyltransferase [Anaerolineales bacterium]
MRIRPATKDDALAAVDLMTQLAEYAGEIVDAGVEDRFRTMLELPQHAIFVAEDERGLAVGLLSASLRWTLWHAGPCMIIEELIVDEEARGQGVGRALIQAALDWARGQGCSEVEVSTEQANVKAQAFYRQLGFESTALLLETDI